MNSHIFEIKVKEINDWLKIEDQIIFAPFLENCLVGKMKIGPIKIITSKIVSCNLALIIKIKNTRYNLILILKTEFYRFLYFFLLLLAVPN